jgi:hypothetical protein
MLRIRMKSTAAGPSGVFEEGREYPVSDELGEQLVDAGAAELVLEKPKADPASAPGSENASRQAPETAAHRGAQSPRAGGGRPGRERE